MPQDDRKMLLREMESLAESSMSYPLSEISRWSSPFEGWIRTGRLERWSTLRTKESMFLLLIRDMNMGGTAE